MARDAKAKRDWLRVFSDLSGRIVMQRIAVLFLCTGLWSGHAAAGPCEQLGTAAGGFVGGAAGYGVVRTFGAANGWVAAGLYGAGIAIASSGGGAWAESGCNSAADALRWYGEMQCAYSTYYVDCSPAVSVAKSIATDFLICPACTYDEVLGAFFLEDGARQDYLRDMQSRKWGRLAVTTQVLARNHLGAMDASITNSYFMGLQAGFQILKSTQIYRSLK
jgi:hypothetical protein